jgi:hypothetical protein
VPVSAGAVEFDTVIAGTGLLSVLPRVQRVKIGAERAGQLAHIWADEHSVHILIDGTLIKTMASNLAPADLNELRLRGARPAGPPRPPSASASSRPGRSLRPTAPSTPTAASRSAEPKYHWACSSPASASPCAWDGHLLHVIRDGVLAKTLPAPIEAGQRARIRGARLATGSLPMPPPGRCPSSGASRKTG